MHVLFLALPLVFLLPTPPQAQTKFGILYTGWHCLVTKSQGARPFSLVSEAVTGRKAWGPIPEFHFWGEPREGFYCLSERPDVLRRHAEALRDAGIDFIVFDATNAEYADGRSPDARLSIVEPFEHLLKAWSRIKAAPKIVPWAPLTQQGNMLEWMIGRLGAHPELEFSYKGKPLALVTYNNTFRTDESKLSRIARDSTVRLLWGHLSDDTEMWSFISVCQKGFLSAQAHIPCLQRRAVRGGKVEQISVSAAYQETYMSLKETAVPKFGGRTFVRQFETVFDTAPAVALISGWNEWMAQRVCLDNRKEPTDKGCHAGNDRWPDGNRIFVDQYDYEYNRDIEPAKGRSGDLSYRVMKHCIRRYREGRSCHESVIK